MEEMEWFSRAMFGALAANKSDSGNFSELSLAVISDHVS
jgi:hypothetical protein